MKPRTAQSQVSFKKRGVQQQTPINQMNKSQVSVTSQVSQSRSQKSLSQGHSRVSLKSGNETLLQKMSKLPEDVVKLKQQISELRIMELSQEARQSLMKLQRFDRFIFPMQSDRILKKPVQEELKRLEKIKNEQSDMRGKLYDNQLTITALYNHIKLIHQMNRQLEQREVLRKQKEDAVRMMHEQKRESLKQVRELKQQIRMGTKSLTPVKVQKQQKQPQQTTPMTTPLKKQEITTLNFIAATLRGKKYAEAIQQIKKFLTKSGSSQPQACKLLQMFLPALQDQLTTIVQTKTVETKYSQFSILIEKTNKQIRVNHFDQLEKMKIQALKSNSQFKSIGLLLQSILNMKKADQADKKKRVPGDDSKSLEKVNQRIKSIQDELKTTKQELFKEKATNAQNLKAKQAIQKQLQKLKTDFDRAQAQLQNYKKIQADQKRLPSKSKVNQQQIKTVRQQLNNQRGLKVNLEKQVQKLTVEIENLKKSNAETVRATSKSKQNDEELKTLREQLKNQKLAKTNLEREMLKLQSQLKPIRDQLTNQSTIRVNLQKEIQRIQGEYQQLKRSETDMKKSAVRSKQNQDDVKNLRQQLNTQRAAKVNFERENQKLQNQLKPLRQQINNERNAKAQLEKEVQRVRSEYDTLRKTQAQIKRSANKMKQNQDDLKNLREQLSNQRSAKVNFERENQKLLIQLKPLRQQINNEKEAKVELQKQIQRVRSEYETLRRSQAQIKKSANKIKQNQEQLKNIKQQLATQRSTKVNLERQSKKLQTEVGPLRQQLSNQKASHAQLQQQFNRISNELSQIKRSEIEGKKAQSRLKQLEEDINSLREQISNQRALKQNLEKQNRKLQQQLKPLKDQLSNQRASKQELLKDLQSYTGEVHTSKKIQNDLKISLVKIRQSQDEIKSLRQQIANERAKIYGLQQQIQRLQSQAEINRKTSVQSKKVILKSQQNEEQIRSLKDQLAQIRTTYNQTNKNNKTLQKQIQVVKNQNQKLKRLQSDLDTIKKSQSDLKKIVNKAKNTQEQLRKTKQNLSNEIEDNNEGKRIRKNMQGQIQKLKVQVQRLKVIQTQFQELKNIEGEFRRNSEKLRATSDQARVSKEQLQVQRTKVYEISRDKQLLQRQIEKLLAQIDMYRKNEVEIKSRELQNIKKVQLQAKSKEELLIHNLQQDIFKAQTDLNYSLDSIQKIVTASSSARPLDDLEKLRRQLTSSQQSASRKILPVLQTFIRSNNRSIQLQSMIEKMTKEDNERRRKSEDTIKSLTNQIGEFRQNGNQIAQALKSAARIWTRTKSEELYSNNKIIQILEAELKKGNYVRHLQNIESEVVTIVESLANLILGELSKIEDGYIKIIEQKNRQIQKTLTKQQLLSKSEAEKEKKIIQLEELLKNANNGVDQIKREGLTYVRQIQRIMKQHQKVIYEANLTAQQLNKQIENGSKLNKQIINLKKQITRLTGQKQALDLKLQEGNMQVSRLKKHTQDYVQQQRKVLQTLQLEGKQKQKFQRELQNLQRALQKAEKQRQFYEKKSKSQDAELLKLKQIEIILQNTIQQNEIQNSILNTTIMSRDKEVKNLNDRHRLMIEEKDQLEQQIILLEKQLGSAKFQIEKANRQIKDSQELHQRHKYDYSRQVQRLNLQIKFENQERQSDKRHHATIVTRLEKHLGDAEAHRIQQVKDIQNKMELMLKQKEEVRKQLENQQSKYREKLRQVNRDLELTSITGERQKVQMKRQIDRLTQQLNTAIETSQIQKAELRRAYEKVQIQKQKIIQQKIQQKRVLQQDIQRAKNQEYQQNYEKLRKQREQIRILQEEVDKLNEIIDINEGNYNKIVEDNRQMFEKITELQNSQKTYTQQVQMLKDKSVGDLNTVQLQTSRNSQLTKHVQKLQAQVKQFEIIIATNNRQMTFTNTLKDRVKELESRVDNLQHENIKLKVHEDENLKQMTKFREETIQLKAENAALDKELYAMKSKPDTSQSQTILFSKYEDMTRKYELVNEESMKYKFETSNFERLLKQKQFQTIKALELKHLQMEKDLLQNNWKQRMDALNERFKQQAKDLETTRVNLQAKKEQYSNDIMNFKIDKDRLERSVSDLERRLAQIKQENGRLSRQNAIRDQEKKLNIEKYSTLLKNYEDKVKDLQKSELQNRNLVNENKQFNQQMAMKQQSNNRQIQRITEMSNNRIQILQKDLQQKRKIIDQKQLQIRQFITKFTSQSNEKTAVYTQKQMEYQTSSILYERTIQDLKKQNARLQNQLQTTNKKLEQKIVQSSSLLMDLKQTQSDRQLADEQAKYRIQTLSTKINDLLRQIDALRNELKNNISLIDNQRQYNRQDKQKLQKSLYETSNRIRLLEDALQKIKIEKVTLMEREKSLRAQLQAQDQQLRKIQEKSSKIEGGTIKVKEQNKYLKQIVQMLDTNYVQDEQEDENQIKILVKISQQISYLIERNIQLQTQVKSTSHRSQTNDEQWLSSIEFLIQSLLDYLNESQLIGHKNVTKFVYSAEFKAESLYDQKEKYMVYVENFIKELFQNVVSQLSQNISLYEKTFSDLRKFVESYFSSGDQRYLESLKKCLKKFEN